MTDEELIRQVAEEVMGWDCAYTHVPSKIRQTKWGTTTILEPMEKFNPLLNANHWMMVVERMRELGYFFRLGNCMERSWGAKFSKDGYGIRLTFEKIYTDVGMAVCEAALKAVKEEKLPKLTDLRGIAPNLTEGLSSEDFVRKGRDEDG